MLKPDKNIQKFVLSTPSYFVGDYKSDKFRLDPIFPSLEESFKMLQNITSNPYSRNFIKLTYNSWADVKDNDTKMASLHRKFAKRLMILMSIFFGKCFYDHGFVEENGHSFITQIQDKKPQRYYFIPPFSQLPRKDLGDLTVIKAPLNLSLEKVGIIAPLIESILDDSEFNNILFTAGSLYLHSLQSFCDEPEIAYLDLISSGEVLSNYSGFDFKLADLLPENLKEEFEKLEKKCGDVLNVESFKNNFRSIKRRFTLTLKGLLNDYYFENENSDLPHLPQVKDSYLNRLSADAAETRIKYSYDLRSKFLHAGKTFGQYIVPFTNFISEYRVGKVVIDTDDSDFKRALNKCLLYVGLERLIRFCLLRFIQKFGKVHLDDRLNDG